MERLQKLLDSKYLFYNKEEFIETDPIQIPRAFSQREDVEIAGFIAAAIAWGKRPMIIRNANRWLEMMDNAPYDFVMNASEEDLKPLLHFVHRTFNGDDALFFITSLQNIYKNHGGLESVFAKGMNQNFDNPRNYSPLFGALNYFRKVFMSSPHLARSGKHIANPMKGSAAKRLNMYLRWMIRQDEKGVDFGIWKSIEPKHLMIPLDVHSGRVARKLGLLNRKANDWKSVEELTTNLRQFDATDPVKYDFALFGMGVFGEM
jgi:uncharacterized protein (TIGR02757 family)